MGSCRFEFHWVINTLVVLSLFGLIGIVQMNWISFPKIGFYCDDPKIAHKFNGDTIPVSYLFALTLLGPLLLMSLVEYSLVRSVASLKRAWKWFAQFAFGLLLLIFIVEAGKSIVSEPRPHFLDTCRPDKAINCTSGYVSEYTCTNVNIKSYLLKDATRSFPSGHSAMGFYSSVFIVMFLQNRIPDTKFLVVPWLQCLCLMWGILCALTRITDRRHHWWDVAIGSACGVILAKYAVRRLCNDFNCRKISEADSEDSGSSTKTFASRRLLSSTSSYSPPFDKDPNVLS